jgi:hypothetical protein
MYNALMIDDLSLMEEQKRRSQLFLLTIAQLAFYLRVMMD